VSFTVINTGNSCKVCDGYGVMTLYGGPANPNILAPCLRCAQARTLQECLNERAEAIRAYRLAKEKALIHEHNERIREKE